MENCSSEKTDEYYMNRALQLAQRGAGFTSPNPLVGAVVVKDGEIIGEGYHPEYGARHAEVFAIEEAGREAENAVLYVNLEPCNHYGKTPPCTEKILDAGIKKVVVANIDSNPRVNCEGCEKLRDHNIEVETGVLAKKGRKLNETFFKYIEDKRPFFVQKTAQTIDGYLATSTGDSQWITGDESRAYGHKLRHELDAVLVGGNTLKSDNPSLTVRDYEGYEGKKSQPLRIVLAGDSEIFPGANIFNSQGGETLIFSQEETAFKLKNKLNDVANSEIIVVDKADKEFLDLTQVAKELYEREIMSVLIEGGGSINHSFLDAQLIDKYYFFVASKILGGDDGIAAFSGSAVKKISETFKFNIEKIERLQEDILISAYPRY